MKAGIVGCGNISGIYIENSKRFQKYEVVACADIHMEKAAETALKYGIASMTVEDMMVSPDIDIVINLTVPSVHAEISIEAIRNGKHVYSEKPLAVSFEDGKRVLAEAEKFRVIVGSAPDTFLGGSIQLAGELIEEGSLGRIVGASSFMMSRGPESWHPNPEFFYQKGGGPMYDMGPYYLTALANLFGPVKRLTGSAAITFSERVITAPEKFGDIITVEVPTHVSGILEFAAGGSATITTSFDVSSARTPFLEVYLERGTISLPDPNYFNLPLLVKRQNEDEWTELKPEGEAYDNMRGLGVCYLVDAITDGREPHASGKLALHVLEMMHGIHQSSETGSHYQMETTYQKVHVKKAEYQG
ncbi:oxidoreductase [Bacillus sp. FJAT-27225]|uniref:Gfo/Idh/MocA family protein n=1 Tax=Bacillus sp. FJAT-27225 TaxID=1743144 RepID=UPI00080C2B83|nr:Gfo/Idh/MocA family oxidoreductase [Bacillus sp. FJAT-27225]OCA88059.1 oxidoreductase [Bacillus sp. FJAT-27225]